MYSQTGGDILIRYAFSNLGINTFSWLDIGAHHPFKISNTAAFYKIGLRGINIEGDPKLIKKFYERRPEDINLNVLISNKSGIHTFLATSYVHSLGSHILPSQIVLGLL